MRSVLAYLSKICVRARHFLAMTLTIFLIAELSDFFFTLSTYSSRDFTETACESLSRTRMTRVMSKYGNKYAQSIVKDVAESWRTGNKISWLFRFLRA